MTRIAVWNSGNEVINAEDIVESEPLSIKIINGKSDDIRILDSSIEYVTDKTNKFDIPSEVSTEENKDESCTYKDVVNFNFVGKRDGFILQIIHTGNPAYIYLNCHIKGGQDIYEIDSYGRKIHNLRENESLYSFFSKRKIPFAQDRTVDDFIGYSILTYYARLIVLGTAFLGLFLVLLSGFLTGFGDISPIFESIFLVLHFFMLLILIVSVVFFTPLIYDGKIPIKVPAKLRKKI